MKKLLNKLLLGMAMTSLGVGVSAQNILNNPSFEDRDPSANSNTPEENNRNQVFRLGNLINSNEKFVEHWETRSKTFTFEENGQCGGGNTIHMHAVDWYFDDVNYLDDYGPGAQGTSKYIGMGGYSLLTQRLNTGRQWDEGEIYVAEMYIQLADGFDGDAGWLTDSELYLYTSQNRIEYKKETDPAANLCTDGYITHKNGINDIETLHVFDDLNYTNYPAGSWHKIQCFFRGKPDNYNWLTLEVRSPGYDKDADDDVICSCSSDYLLIDELKVYKLEDHPCAVNTGAPDLQINSSDLNYGTGVNVNMEIDNCLGYTLAIKDNGNNTLWAQSEFNPNGLNNIGTPANPVYDINWNGRFSNGDWADPQDDLTFLIYYYNLNSSFAIGGNIDVFGTSASLPPALPLQTPMSGQNRWYLTNCCQEYHVFSEPDDYYPGTYLASQYIALNGTFEVPDDGRIAFIAPDFINLSETEFPEGSEVSITPGSCTPVNFKQNSSPVEELIPEIEADFQVFPNPSNGLVRIQGSAIEEGEPVLVEVLNLSGAIIYQKTIRWTPESPFVLDLGAFPSGMYLLKANSSKDQFVRKLIKQ